MVLEIIHRYVEVLDKWFLNVCELDIIFNFQQAYTIIGGFWILFAVDSFFLKVVDSSFVMAVG
jgi:hypothetical protein